MGFFDRFTRGKTPAGPDARADARADAGEDTGSAGGTGDPTHLEGTWTGVVPVGLPPKVDVDRPGLAFALNAEELKGVAGAKAIVREVGTPGTEPALAAYLTVIVAIAADLARRGVAITELRLAEPASPWRALPFVPIVARLPDGKEAAVLVNPVPVTEREVLSFFVLAGALRRAPRFATSPIAVYSPSPLPLPYVRLADAELPGLLEGDLAPVLATRTPKPAEGARLFAEAVARRAGLHLDGKRASLPKLESALGAFSGRRYGNVARVALAAYVGEVVVASKVARWEGDLPAATLVVGEKRMQTLQMARDFLPADGAPRIAEFVARVEALSK